MRKFILWSKDKSIKFNLTKNVVPVDPQGLGNKFAPKYLETSNGRHLTNITPNFDAIKLKLYFNTNGQNGYGFYNQLLTFFSNIGLDKFLFEYTTNINTKYCEVVLQNAPKSEINESGEFVEEFIFERQTYWFEEIKQTFTLRTYTDTGFKFPLPFPFGFSGIYLTNKCQMSNEFAVAAPITVKVSGSIANPLNIFIEKPETGERVAEMQLTVGNQDGHEIIIDPNDKKVTQITPDGELNAYDLVDKTKQTFLHLPRGKYVIGANLDDEDTGRIELSIRRYLFD